MEKTYGVWAVLSSASIFGHAEAWCKEDGKTLEFDTREAAEAYCRDANSHTTGNVCCYAREKEPEPSAIRKRAAQLDLDDHAHTDLTPRNDSVEKLNEIPCRQFIPEPEPMVAIRSAVHSNYAGMVAMLGVDNLVYLGDFIIIKTDSRPTMITVIELFSLSQTGRICIISFTEKGGRTLRRLCWSVD